jgi:pyrimidine deaminase RibD-like protein/very-short-patch-repair endonuclease
LRQVDNSAEAKLWYHLRNRQFHGLKFMRQLPIGPYFADLACRDLRLVVEVDGSQHLDSIYDERRNLFMQAEGWSVARFWYVDVMRSTDAVLETLACVIDGRIRAPVTSREFNFYPAKPMIDIQSEFYMSHIFMRRAIALARTQYGRTAPNPSVGCVIVKGAAVIGEGATGDGGRPHAEEIALSMAGDQAVGATAYVTLEPCGARSQGGLSCAEKLVSAGIIRVIYACSDPSPYAAQKGPKLMQAAGLQVDSGFMADEAAGLSL